MKTSRPGEIRQLLSGGDRRSIADSNRVRLLVENNPSLVVELIALTADEDWLVTQRAIQSACSCASFSRRSSARCRLDRAAQEDLHRPARSERQVGNSAPDRSCPAVVPLESDTSASRRGDTARERGVSADLRARVGARRPCHTRGTQGGAHANRTEAPPRLRAVAEQGTSGEGEADSGTPQQAGRASDEAEYHGVISMRPEIPAECRMPLRCPGRNRSAAGSASAPSPLD